VVCLNAEAEAECAAEGFGPERRFCVPNGFPVRDVTPRADYRGRSGVLVLYAGRLDEQKDVSTLLEAMARASRAPEGAGVRARLLGDGPDREKLESRARDLGITETVEILGRVDDVPSHLREADIFVLPSLSEGISNALLEAMAHGVPCVASRIPGNADLVIDRETGILFEPRDAGALAGAVLDLAADSALRERLGRAGRELVEERFDIDSVAGKYAEMYRELASSRQGVARSPAPAR
jgi:glycosyltransferase involved in cell wall biosynthesis